MIAQTDSAGTYRFPSLRRGMYVLRAKLAGYSDATSGSFVIGENETKSIILALKPLKAETTSSPATATEFFDEPSFTVAGVTDTTNLGGHGSDTIVRTKEALAKDTVSLGKGLQARSSKASSVNQSEIVLQEAAAHEPGNFDVISWESCWLRKENLEKRSHISSGLPSSIRAPTQTLIS